MEFDSSKEKGQGLMGIRIKKDVGNVPLWMLTFLEDIDAGASYVWSHAKEHPRYGASPRAEVAPTLTKGIESPSSTSHGFWDEWWRIHILEALEAFSDMGMAGNFLQADREFNE
ncbi:hypothetical protein CsSME_00020443 [Camellia sinensis var. sinensis]